MANTSNNDTFVRITNQDIFELVTQVQQTNNEQHSEMLAHQHYTNGKVKLNTWRSTLTLGLVISVILGIAGLKLSGAI